LAKGSSLFHDPGKVGSPERYGYSQTRKRPMDRQLFV
jgi:hypothetical protein